MTTPHDPDLPEDGEPHGTDSAGGSEDAATREVRRLLAEAGADAEPLPGAVRERLDATLAELTAGRELPGAVVALHSRRRRRVFQGLVAAAAAVVVVGLGFQFADNDSPDSMDALAEEQPERGTTTSQDAAGGTAAREQDSAESFGDTSADGDAPPSTMQQRDGSGRIDEVTVVDEPLTVLRSRRLREDLVLLQRSRLPHPAAADYSRASLTAPQGFKCMPTAPGNGVLVAVRYQRAPAVVAFREPVGTTQVAEILQCGTDEVLNSSTLPASD